jgi:ribonuclease HII
MNRPSLQEEKKIWRKGSKYVACLDEAGRGPLAGPVVAAACVILDYRLKTRDFKGLKDSKKLSRGQREKFYKVITGNKNIDWGIGKISEKVIDKINILEASRLAMEKAVAKLKKKPDFLILDGKMKLDLPILQKSIVKADEKVFSCAAASILAKVTRDRIMEKYHLKYPRYSLNDHQGYPTKMHLKRLKRYGPSKIHRRSFGPVRACKTKRTVVI